MIRRRSKHALRSPRLTRRQNNMILNLRGEEGEGLFFQAIDKLSSAEQPVSYRVRLGRPKKDR